MTEALKRAFEKAAQLPDADQDSLAAATLSEIQGDEVWDESFSVSENALSALADEALEEHRQGLTRSLDPKKP
jgi:hypothetical protein